MSTLARQSAPVPALVIQQFDLDGQDLVDLKSGHINDSWAVSRRDGSRCILQRVNRIFPANIHDDIQTVCAHLRANDVVAPELISTPSGQLWLEANGDIWRLQTRIGGTTKEAVESDAVAREAGYCLGRFHAALADLNHDFAHARLGVHDTQRHLAALETTLYKKQGHAQLATVAPLADEVLALAANIVDVPGAPERIVHGDPKVSNILFDDDNRGVCLIDLDTLTRMPVALELGDAFRSWCNPEPEDSGEARFLTDRFAAAIAGYRDGSNGLLLEAEWLALPHATYRIAVELAARFCADALNEAYFGWDSSRFASASAHNQARTRGQLALARGIAAELRPMLAIVERELPHN